MTEHAATPRRPNAGRRPAPGLVLALRIVVSAAFLVLLAFKAPHPGDLIPSQHHALTFTLLIAALGMTLLGVVLSAWRWQRVLYLFDTPVALRTLTTTYLAGLFVGNVLPSTIGGDVIRVTRTTKTVDSSTVAFGSVVLERLTGFVALPVLVVLGFAIQPSLLESPHAWVALLVAAITIIVLAALLVVAGHPRLAGRYADNAGWTRFIGAVHLGVDRLRRHPSQLGPVLGTAFLYQLSVVVTFALVFRALDVPLPLAGVLAFSPAVLMLQVLPLSLSGLGVREGALVLFMHPYLSSHGISDSRAITAGLLWYGCMLVISMLGAPAFAMGHRRLAPEPIGVSTAESGQE
jgi:hypothetical protein